MEIVKINGDALRYASDILKNDEKFLSEAKKSWEGRLQYAPDRFKNDKEIVLEAVKY